MEEELDKCLDSETSLQGHHVIAIVIAGALAETFMDELDTAEKLHLLQHHVDRREEQLPYSVLACSYLLALDYVHTVDEQVPDWLKDEEHDYCFLEVQIRELVR